MATNQHAVNPAPARIAIAVPPATRIIHGERSARRLSKQGNWPLEFSWAETLRAAGWRCQPSDANEASRESRFVGSALSLSSSFASGLRGGSLTDGNDDVGSIGDQRVHAKFDETQRVIRPIDGPDVDAETRVMSGVYPGS